MSQSQIGLIRDAIYAAESSIILAKKLLLELEDGRSKRFDSRVRDGGSRKFDRDRGFDKKNKDSRDWRFNRKDMNVREDKKIMSSQSKVEALTGVFNGLDMITDDGKKTPVFKDYIVKSMIVEGDRLKFVKEDGQELFKQIQRVKRDRLIGVLAKKDGEFNVVTEKGSFRIPSESIEYFKIKEGDNVMVIVPSEGKSSWAAVENLAPKKEELQKKETELQEKKGALEEKKATKKKITRKKVSQEEKDDVKEKTKSVQVIFDNEKEKNAGVVKTKDTVENINGSDEDVLQ